MRTAGLFTCTIAGISMLMFAACGEDEEQHEDCPEGHVCIEADEAYCPNTGDMCADPAVGYCPTEGDTCMAGLGDPANYKIELTVGHIHIWREVAMVFTVRDLDDCTDPEDEATCQTVSGLPVVAFRRGTSGSMRDQALEAGKLEDEGDGTYTYYRSINDLGAYMVGLKFEEDGHLYFGAFPVETSRAGGERFFCDADSDGTTDYAYQLRWNADGGHLHAEGEDIAFDIEVMRSFNTPVNETQPWMNSFHHLREAEIVGGAPTVVLMEGTNVVATLTTTFKGKGIFQVAYPFANADLVNEEATDFWLDISFTDDDACVVVSSDFEEDFVFTVVPGH